MANLDMVLEKQLLTLRNREIISSGDVNVSPFQHRILDLIPILIENRRFNVPHPHHDKNKPTPLNQ